MIVVITTSKHTVTDTNESFQSTSVHNTWEAFWQWYTSQINDVFNYLLINQLC